LAGGVAFENAFTLAPARVERRIFECANLKKAPQATFSQLINPRA
jgi:hypothetical protein